MSFDWKAFLNQRGIPFIANGHRDIDVHCPWCYPNDREHYVLTISLQGRGWHCWKRRDHRGRRAAQLVAALAHIQFAEAVVITGERYEHIEESLADRIKQLYKPKKPPEIKALKMPEEFRPFSSRTLARSFFSYLVDRGFAQADIPKMTEHYGIRYALHGRQRYRIVFPVYFQNRLVAWTGRTIIKYNDLRYLTSDELHDGATPINNYLLWHDELLKGGDTLAICEGPFDALKLRYLGIMATALFTARATPTQVDLLKRILPLWNRRLVALDRGALASAYEVRDAIGTLDHVGIAQLPPGIKDPGELRSIPEEWNA